MSKLYLKQAQFAAELGKCLQCPSQPCTQACPVKCSPHDFIAAAQKNDLATAATLISAQNPLGETCGLICPDKFCMRACLRQHIDAAIKIPEVQAEIMHRARENNLLSLPPLPPLNGYKIAVVGAGPAGISAAITLLKYGFAVTIFERENSVGGALNLIPAERLPREIIMFEWQRWSNNTAVETRLSTTVTDYKSLLQEGFAAVIVTVGEQKNRSLNIAGEDLGVTYAEYLRHPQKYATNGHVAVIGGGAAAVDCAITAARNGANHVEMFVRRRLSDMRITSQERKALLANQIDITTMTRVVRIEKSVAALTAYTCKTQFNKEGRLEDAPHTATERGGLALIIFALGSTRNEDLITAENIYYAGDIVSGGSTAVEAIASGKQTATDIAVKFGIKI